MILIPKGKGYVAKVDSYPVPNHVLKLAWHCGNRWTGVISIQSSGITYTVTKREDGTILVVQGISKQISEKPSGWGAKLWDVLHHRPLTADLSTEAEWLAGDFAKQVKGGSCQCRKNWLKLLEEFPPNLRSRLAYFFWTIDAHNKINHMRKVRLWTLDEALKHYEHPD